MNILTKTAVVLISCLSLTFAGCAAGSERDTASEKTESEAWVGGLPVIDIKTKNGSSNTFVTEPVNRYVAEQNASWTPGYVIPIEPYYEDCSVTVTDEDSKVLIDSADASVKVRGNWTTLYDKKPLRIKFAEKQQMLGMNGGGEFKNWLLLAEYKDFSMLRNKTALQLAGEILAKDGLYCSDARLAEVRINDEYWGVYLIAEQQQVTKGRIDITEPEKDYTGTDIGYFIEYDGYSHLEEPLKQFSISYHGDDFLKPYDGMNGSGNIVRPSANNTGFTIKSDIYSQEQHDRVMNFVENAYNIMYEAGMNGKAYVMNDDYTAIHEDGSLTPQQAVERVVDVDSLADAYLIAELTCDADLYWSSFFMTLDLGESGSKKLTFTAPWDFDSSLGNKDRCPNGEGFYACNVFTDVNGEGLDKSNPWLMVLMYEDWYRDIIRDKWNGLYGSGAFERACDMITSDSEKYENCFEHNYSKWDNIRNNGSIINELSPRAAACKTEKEAAAYLREWLESRAAFLNSQLS